MTVHLDTNVLALAFTEETPAQLKIDQWVAEGVSLEVCAIAWAEYLCGPILPIHEALARRLFPLPEPILACDAERAASLFNLSGRRKGSLPDCLVAAVALRCGVPLATADAAHFKAYEPHGLNLIEVA
jgi:predicted nucleic acid-binding protein